MRAACPSLKRSHLRDRSGKAEPGERRICILSEWPQPYFKCVEFSGGIGPSIPGRHGADDSPPHNRFGITDSVYAVAVAPVCTQSSRTRSLVAIAQFR